MTIQWNRSGDSPKGGLVRAASEARDESQGSPRRARHSGGVGRVGRRFVIALLVVGLAGAPSLGFAGERAKETGREGGLGAAAALTSLIYAPVKLVYATGGLVVGAFAWAFTAGDTEVASKVFTRSLRGNYVITPDILTGEQELVFIGRDVEAGEARTSAVASASAATAAANAASSAASNEGFDDSGYDEMGW